MSLSVKNNGGERPLTGNASASDVMTGKTFYSTDSGNKQTGTMANRGAVSGSVGVNGTYSSTQNGYVTTVTVTGPTLTGNATVDQVLANRTFYSNDGTIKTGTMVNRGSVGTQTINAGASYTIPAGYHNGQGKVQANVPSVKTVTWWLGDATKTDFYSTVLDTTANKRTCYYQASIMVSSSYSGSCTIEGSNDNTNWTTVMTVNAANNRLVASSGSSSSYRYYRAHHHNSANISSGISGGMMSCINA